ncbi:MAG: hypothetical protein F4170_01895 [Rhodobacteraceae bacterium]|nr:hypothetical protein [Paracoccaceae bacterium]
MKLIRPNKKEVTYGFLGSLFGAVAAAMISLIPWIWPNLDADDRLRESVESGFQQFAKEDDLDLKLEYLNQIDRDIEVSWGVRQMIISRKYRSDVESKLENLALKASLEAELEEIHLAQDTATDDEEREGLEIEKQKVLEQIRLVEEERQRDADLKQQHIEEQHRLEEQRRNAVLEVERLWINERVCLNDNCTSWTVR